MLFTEIPAGAGSVDESRILVKRFSEKEPRLVIEGGFGARYLPGGHIVYMYRGTLYGAAFNLETLTLNGNAQPLPYNVAYNEEGGLHFHVSSGGDMAYLKGGMVQEVYELSWLDESGISEPLMPPNTYLGFRISPDGQKLAYGLKQGSDQSLYVHDLVKNLSTPLTSSVVVNSEPVWSPDSQSIIFNGDTDDGNTLFWKRIGDRQAASPLAESLGDQFPRAWFRDDQGDHLVVHAKDQDKNPTIKILDLTGDDQKGWTALDSQKSLTIPYTTATLSPDRQWVAFGGRVNKDKQLWVCQFPSGNQLSRVSTLGIMFREPIWSIDQELLYMARVDSRPYDLFRAAWNTNEGAFDAKEPVQWEGVAGDWTYRGNTYDLHPDGKRVLVRTRGFTEQDKGLFKQVYLKQNFLDELNALIPLQNN